MTVKIIFFVALLIAASSFVSPPIALAMGLLFGLIFVHPFPKESARVTRIADCTSAGAP